MQMIRSIPRRKIARFLYATILICCFVSVGLTQTPSIFGVYGQCWFACRYLKIKPDFTFEQLLAGDLFNGERKRGKWKFIDKNKISAQTPRPNQELNVKETASGRSSFIITVIDQYDALVASATVFVSSEAKTPICTTSDNGTCEIPKTGTFEIGFDKFRGGYKLKNPNSDTFVVTLADEQMERPIDEVWLIEGDRLCVSDLDSKIDKADYMEKVSSKKARSLFPK